MDITPTTRSGLSETAFEDIGQLIIDGMKSGVDRQWRFAKELLSIKPEYLLTVSVADELSHRLDFGVRLSLEATTREVVFAIRMSALGWTDFFAQKSLWDGRNGKVDILLLRDTVGQRIRPAGLCVVELKNIDPPKSEIRKDVERLLAFLRLTPERSPMMCGYLAYLSTCSGMDALRSLVSPIVPSTVDAAVTEERVITGEDPEDGIPAFHAIVLKLRRRDAGAAHTE